MRRRQAATVAVAAFFLTLAPLLRWYTLPRVEQAPQDIDSVDVSSGLGRYLDPATGKVAGPARITVTRHVVGDVAEGKRTGFAVWDVATRTDIPATLSQPDPRAAYSFSVSRWVFDRHTNAPQICCGGSPGAAGDAYLKFPFDLGRRDYEVWDATAGRTYLARFAGTQTISGHGFYRFAGEVPPTRIGSLTVPGAVLGLATKDFVAGDEYYANDDEVTVVDPATGELVAGSSHLHITLRAPGGVTDLITVLDVDLTPDPATTDTAVHRAVVDSSRLSVVSTAGPIASAVAGVACAGFATGAAIRGRAARRHPLSRPVEESVSS